MPWAKGRKAQPKGKLSPVIIGGIVVAVVYQATVAWANVRQWIRLSDIGGRRTLHAYLDDAGQIHLTEDPTVAKAGTVASAPRGVPGPGTLIVLAVGMACALAWTRR